MPGPPGHIGNLTAEQEQKLRELWALLLKLFDFKDPRDKSAGTEATAAIASPSEVAVQPDTPTSTGKKSNSKKLQSIFGGISSSKKSQTINDVSNTPSTPSNGSATDGDKYGQSKDFQKTLGELSAEELKSTFWAMVKADHPDSLLLRFLRARKWDTQRALVMLVSTMRWRCKEMQVDEDVVRQGEGGALADSKRTENGADLARKEGEDFLAQMRKGKSFLHGVDKEGRPLCFVRARLHRQGEQSERAMERYTVHVIETARLVLTPPVETATILFDMSSFTMSNMEYAPVKFMIKVFEANYPESLGAVLVHKAPWVFQSIWTIIKGWLDPVVAAKVHFTKSVADLERFIPRDHIIKELGGDEDWEYRYLEPVEGENAAIADTQTRQKLEEERNQFVDRFHKNTMDWLAANATTMPTTPTPSTPSAQSDTKKSAASAAIVDERNTLANHLTNNYWSLDPYIRARSLYDRQGMIGPGGRINFYPPPPSSSSTVTTTSTTQQPSKAPTDTNDAAMPNGHGPPAPATAGNERDAVGHGKTTGPDDVD